MSIINQRIEEDKNLLNNPLISPQSRRHTEDELVLLEKYKENHPENDHNPSSLELYCNVHPEALECRIYED
jgi:hypothetical protein